MKILQTLGMYQGMLDYFSEKGIRLALFAAFALVYFMLFSALKLIANTVTELSLCFSQMTLKGQSEKNQIRLFNLCRRRNSFLCARAEWFLDCGVICRCYARLFDFHGVQNLFDTLDRFADRFYIA